MKFTSAALFLVSAPFQNTHAFMISDLEPAQNHPAVCSVSTTKPNKNLIQIKDCSGTLIAPDLILTAAHCVENAVDTITTTITVKCPQEPTSLSGIAAAHAMSFTDVSTTPGTDFALIRLSNSVKNTVPMKVITDGETLQSVIHKKCYLGGYGLTNGKHPEDSLNTAQISDLRILQHKKSNQWIIVSSDPHTRSDHGDSGGSLYCKLPGGEMALVGVTSSGSTYPGENYRESNFGPTTSLSWTLENIDSTLSDAENNLRAKAHQLLNILRNDNDIVTREVLAAIESNSNKVILPLKLNGTLTFALDPRLKRPSRHFKFATYSPESSTARKTWAIATYSASVNDSISQIRTVYKRYLNSR